MGTVSTMYTTTPALFCLNASIGQYWPQDKNKMEMKGIMKNRLYFGAVFILGTGSVFAQTNDPGTLTAPAPALNFFTSLAQNYPWVCTVLVVIGALRVLFKPVMTLLDGYIKDNCSPAEYAKLQSFEAGAVYKWLSFAFDLVGSIKLPVIGIKPPQDGK